MLYRHVSLRPRVLLRRVAVSKPRPWCRDLFGLRSFSCKSAQKESRRADLRTAGLSSLRVIIHVLQRIWQPCISPIFTGFSLLRLAPCCTVLRSRWCQSRVKQHRFSVSMPRRSHSLPVLWPTKVSGQQGDWRFGKRARHVAPAHPRTWLRQSADPQAGQRS
jgi:hypothetical protein